MRLSAFSYIYWAFPCCVKCLLMFFAHFLLGCLRLFYWLVRDFSGLAYTCFGHTWFVVYCRVHLQTRCSCMIYFVNLYTRVQAGPSPGAAGESPFLQNRTLVCTATNHHVRTWESRYSAIYWALGFCWNHFSLLPPVLEPQFLPLPKILASSKRSKEGMKYVHCWNVCPGYGGRQGCVCVHT